jgi:hypothetical protein
MILDMSIVKHFEYVNQQAFFNLIPDPPARCWIGAGSYGFYSCIVEVLLTDIHMYVLCIWQMIVKPSAPKSQRRQNIELMV